MEWPDTIARHRRTWDYASNTVQNLRGRRTVLGFSQVFLDYALKRVGVRLLDSGLPQMPAHPMPRAPFKDVRPGRDQHGVISQRRITRIARQESQDLMAGGYGIKQQREQHRNIVVFEVVEPVMPNAINVIPDEHPA